ncbi:Myblike DNAbinding domain-containing protein [Tilletia horrida]|nr:Myblike DNAbinding domain-containing protein [Tilletia horrida]KAK0525208.1 Myblike DNAbinding domain-containing protein [Tilletia horrida]
MQSPDADAREAESSSSSNASAAADRALLRYLKAQRRGIATAEKQIDVRIQHNDGASLLLSAAYQELELGRALLAQADELEAQDRRPTAHASAKAIGTLSKLSTLAAKEPSLRLKAPPRAKFERLVSGPSWTAGDTAKLRQITLAECKSILAHRMLRHHDANEVISLIERMSDEEVAQASIPGWDAEGKALKDPRAQGSREGEGVDWVMVSQIVGRHGPDDCRTHWLMQAMPGIKSGTWSSEELANLFAIVDTCKQRSPLVSWEDVAKDVGGGRTGYACLAAYRRHTASSDASAWTEEDTDAMLEHVSIYGPQWSYIATKLPHPHLPANVSKQFAKLQKS